MNILQLLPPRLPPRSPPAPAVTGTNRPAAMSVRRVLHWQRPRYRACCIAAIAAALLNAPILSDGAADPRALAEPAWTLQATGPHSRIWTVPPTERVLTNSQGVVVRRSVAPAGKIREVASGMNFWDGEAWRPSDPSLSVAPDGRSFVANNLQYKVRLSADLRTSGAYPG